LRGSRVRLVALCVGGGFGMKAILYPEDAALCLLAMRLGRPVKWVEARRERLPADAEPRGHARARRGPRAARAPPRGGCGRGLWAPALAPAPRWTPAASPWWAPPICLTPRPR